MGTDGEVKVGTLRGSVRLGLLAMKGGVRPGFVHTRTPGLEQTSNVTAWHSSLLVLSE
jgi:hypothetical protein